MTLYETIANDLSCGWKMLPMTKSQQQCWSKDHLRFLVTFQYQDRKIEFNNFSKETLESQALFEHLILDAMSVHKRNFYTFCQEFGWNNDSIKALNWYKTFKKNAKKLKYLVGQDIYMQLIFEEPSNLRLSAS
jgi:hypothetical protein